MSIQLSSSGINHEVNFWRGFVRTERFKNNWCSSTRNPELNDVTYSFLKGLNPKVVLDVGSGPVSILRGTCNNIVTCDPLGKEYASMVDFNALKIDPPFPHPAEELPEEWVDQFSVVHCSNAIDHTVNPVDCYFNLLNCVEPGGYLIIQGFEKEATFENYAGFHQYNVYLSDDGLHIDGKDQKTIIPKDKDVIISTTLTLETGRNWVVWIIQKTK